jgi:type VI protein secretion system component Hcp
MKSRVALLIARALRFWGLLVAVLISVPAGAASDTAISVCIDGPRCFSAASAGFEVANVEDSSGSGGSVGKTIYSVLSIVKATDNLSPALLRWATMGTHIRQVIVTVTPKDQLPYTITAKDVTIARFKSAASVGTEIAQEVVEFRYGEICVESGGSYACSQP